jgi:predicted RNase H-like nuclease (RuvC/YqgF family)
MTTSAALVQGAAQRLQEALSQAASDYQRSVAAAYQEYEAAMFKAYSAHIEENQEVLTMKGGL